MSLFNSIKKGTDYWLVDQVKTEPATKQDYIEALSKLLNDWRIEGVGYLSLLMDASYEEWLFEKGFQKISTIVEYTRQLDVSFVPHSGILAIALSDSPMDDSTFADFYERCRSGSANKNKLFTIEQVLASFENELGAAWRTHCFVFYKDDKPVGLSIPHIEQGTADEGRMFYFGVVPELRGKGFGTIIHRLSLELLKNIGASTYVGSTDENNHQMIRIFEKNGCCLRDRKGIYQIDNK